MNLFYALQGLEINVRCGCRSLPAAYSPASSGVNTSLRQGPVMSQ